ncbi:MAG: hypothetical protein ACRDPK_10440 [Carbonactinosporaceae bacterium]
MGWCWRFLREENLDYQFVLHDEAIVQVVNARRTGKPVNALCAMAAEIPPLERSRGLAAEVLRGMRGIAARHGLARLVAPVRPSWKDRYPLTPIERYVTWRREDGTLLDPWMRVHERLGARVDPPDAGVVSDHRHGRRVGVVERHGLPGDGVLRVPAGAGSATRRPRGRPLRLLGAQRVDGSPRHRVTRWAFGAMLRT